ncbi:MAG TPA: DPP IV N-terminal domain-containing protein [Gaiellaceae bacterium]|nr:DPP IV N-terminal domain-containing protein [Gaiellaceae bacterium]
MRRRTLTLGLLSAALLTLASCGGGGSGSPDLAFVSSRDGDYAIFVMASDGSGQRRLTDQDGNASGIATVFFQIDPAWSPDGSEIAFASRRTGSSDIYAMAGDGTGTSHLTSGKQNDSHPTWSPDAGRIAFARDGDIYVMNADGSRAHRISDINAEESDPAWSPDGKLIAYIRRTPGTPIQNVWVMQPDGSDRRPLTKQNGRAFTPAWSPDGTRIVFTTNAGSQHFELFTIGTDGKGLRSVVPTASDDFEPSWSPDGSKIAYQEEGAIFTIELGGDRAVDKLTDYSTNDSSPVWNPRPAATD